MPTYKAPTRDLQFVLHDVLGVDDLYASLPTFEDVSADLIDAILEQGAKFCEDVIAPLNESGDEEGCRWSAEGVKTPAGFAQAYDQYVQGGWPSLAADVEYGGQGMPNTLGLCMSELTGTANWAWSMYPGLSHGAIKTLEEHGSEEQKQRYLTRLISGEWTGTMCLTEPHCGTDLGLLRTKAVRNDDGSFSLHGTKIFISAGEHDMAENIVHIVIARIEGAPDGTKGISLFVVPKVNVNEDGSLGERNSVNCASIESKMGIKASATCVMNFDGAKGYLIGPENRGLNCMFTFMNAARLGTAVQGLCHAELAYQGAFNYARERLAMRSLTGAKNPDGPADPILVHPDVRRMLLTQRAIAEGSRAFLFFLAMQGDVMRAGNEEQAKRADNLMALLTPIAKAFVTELGFEAANHGVQVLGGHGYIREWGMEQIVRDARIAMLYEGTTGVQAMDLIGRKVLGSGGKLLMDFTAIMDEFCQSGHPEQVADYISTVNTLKDEWLTLSLSIGEKAMHNADEAGAASVDYLMYSGYVVLAYFWAQLASTAARLLDDPDRAGDADFLRAKLMTAEFYFKRLLPRAQGHKLAIDGGSEPLMQMPEALFAVS
ncbi:MAG: acyl-CoA dehydrogenase C-terminal domain-containing protein [Halieaceae bacterium]|nr:acyl-CoA dehydrogenase C-terminal domain-containing protein [Halieaceae bacterium]